MGDQEEIQLASPRAPFPSKSPLLTPNFMELLTLIWLSFLFLAYLETVVSSPRRTLIMTDSKEDEPGPFWYPGPVVLPADTESESEGEMDLEEPGGPSEVADIPVTAGFDSEEKEEDHEPLLDARFGRLRKRQEYLYGKRK